MKKWLVLMLILVTVLCLTATVSAESGTCGDTVQWTLKDGTLTVSGTGEMENSMDKESRPWHSVRGKVKKLVVEEGVTSLSWAAFADFPALTEVSLPGTLTSIGNQAFENCTALKTIAIPDGVTQMGGFVFDGCTSLASAKLSAGLDTIPIYTFQNCMGLKNFTIPANIKTVGNYAFAGTGLTHITVPSTVETLGTHVFNGCKNLKTYDLQPELLTLPDGLFYGCSSLTEAAIPASVQKIGKSCFQNCTGLTTITIPGKYTYEIGNSAFRGCTGIVNLTIPDSITVVGDGAFDGMTGLKKVHLGKRISNASFRRDSAYAGRAFVDCPNIEEFTVSPTYPDLKVYDGAVYDDEMAYLYFVPAAKTAIDLAPTLKYVEFFAFRDCTKLTEVKFPDGTLKLKTGALYGCTGLQDVYLPDSMTTIDGNVFGATNSPDIHYAGSESQWENISVNSYNKEFKASAVIFDAGTGDTDKGNAAETIAALKNMTNICRKGAQSLRNPGGSTLIVGGR